MLCGFAACSRADTAQVQQLLYRVTLDSAEGVAKVQIRIPNNDWLTRIEWSLKKEALHNARGTGEVDTSAERLVWRPAQGKNAELTYTVALKQARPQGDAEPTYRAYHNDAWLIMRADDLVPPFSARFKKGVRAKAELEFVLPKGWQSVYTNYVRVDEHRFVLADRRKVPRPAGWLIAGSSLSARHDTWGATSVSVVGPSGHDVRPMELLAVFGLTQAHFDRLIKDKWPAKVLLVSANDPMWRGGLSADQSLFIHADRPLISENGTSTLIHELFHVLVGIRAAAGYDWITEGLAEFYSVNFLYRSGAYTAERQRETFAGLADWAKDVEVLTTSRSRGPITAKAAERFFALHEELQQRSAGHYNLDDLVRKNIDNKAMTLDQLKQQYQTLLGQESAVLNGLTRLAKP